MTTSASLPLNKGKRPQVQDSQEEIQKAPDLQNATRTAQEPTTDDNRWERAATQFSDIRISTGRKFKNYEFRERIRTSILGKRSV